jgi:carbonic anhydrase/acetyltransferase-like protein (isoleucine patch superfamily)
MKIPDHSFVTGVPGIIRGKPSREQLWWVREGFKTYVELARQYKEQGLSI